MTGADCAIAQDSTATLPAPDPVVEAPPADEPEVESSSADLEQEATDETLQQPFQQAPPPVARPAQPDSIPRPIIGSAQLATIAVPDTIVAIPPTPEEVAYQRILEAVSDSTGGLTPSDALFPMPAHLAGMVWHRPDSLANALSALLEMRESGVRIVRTSVIQDTLLLRAADDLGISFYQDLPVASLPASHLADTLAFAERTLREAIRHAHSYQSARHFGLALFADTSNPDARPYFTHLAQIVAQEGPAGSQSYYLTRFPEDDRCNQTVDFVLLDARQEDPRSVLRRWQLRHDTPVGIGAFGAPVRPGLEGGWRREGTLAYQARTLENGLTAMLETDYPLQSLFVYHWTNIGTTSTDQRAVVEGFSYALVDADNLERPAMDVVRGFFSGTQRIFAFDAGTSVQSARVAAPMVIMGWIIILALGLLYWLAPRFGILAAKYFGRHDLYQESIQRGYDLNAGLNALIAVGLSLSAGVVGASIIRGLARTDALSTAVSSWSLAAQGRLTQLLGQPLLLVVLLALGYGLWLLFNIFWLYILTGRRYRVRAQQALTMAIWSRWTVLALMIGAMLLATFAPRTATNLAPVMLFIWLGIEVVATGRMLNDFAHVTRVPIQRAMLLGYGAPLGLITIVIVSVFIAGSAELGFLWHLATRQ